MTLQNSLVGGSLIAEETSRDEVLELLNVASRWEHDATIEQLSPEGRFNCAYAAALQFAAASVRCAGYRTRGECHHYLVFDILPEIMGDDLQELADYLQMCRTKRNTLLYRRAPAVSCAEVDELIEEVG